MKTFDQFITEAEFFRFASRKNLKDAERYRNTPQSKMLPGISAQRRNKMEKERKKRLSTVPTGTVITDKDREKLLAQIKAQRENRTK